MRNLLMWAGQWILFGLWLMVWPIVVWRWTRCSHFVPRQDLKSIRTECGFGLGILFIFSIYFLSSFEFGWWEIVVAYYVPLGLGAVERARLLHAKYSQPLLLNGPKGSDKQ